MLAPISTINTFINDFTSGRLDETSTHWSLILVIAAAEISLGVGIWIESPKNKTLRQWIGVVLVLGGCIFSALFTVFLLLFDEGINHAQQAKIIFLERAAGPRNLLSEETARIIEVLKPLGGKPYDLTRAPTMESGSFLDNQIVGTLRNAGWTLKSIKSNGEKAQIPFTLFLFSQDPKVAEKMQFLESDIFDSSRLTDIKIGITHDIVGVQILFDMRKVPEFSNAVFALSKEITTAGIGGSAGGVFTSNGMADDVIHVIIGKK